MMRWPRYALRELAPAIPSRSTPHPGEAVWHLGLDQIESHTGIVLTKNRGPLSEAGNSTFHFDRSHVLYSKLRPYLNKVVVPDEPGIATTELIPLQPRPHLVSREYLAYYLRSPVFLAYASQYVAGAKMPRVILDRFWTHEIALPPLTEQRRIVEILDQADRIRRLRTEANAKAERILPALFIKIFGDPATNPMEWPVKPLGEIGELDRGRSRHRPRNDPSLLGGPYPLVQTGEVANSGGRITQYTQTYSDLGLGQSKMWPAGTLCITIAANIANTGVLEFDACFPDSVVGFVPGADTTTEYAQFLLAQLKSVLEGAATQVAQKNINLKMLRSLVVPVPPIDLQNRFSMYVRDQYACRSTQTLVHERLNRLFASATSRLFSGDLTALWRVTHRRESLQEMGGRRRH